VFTEFAEQADLTLIFSSDLVREQTENALVGRNVLEESIQILLKDTGLTPKLSKRSILNITTGDASDSVGEANV
jgi:iron complex outermembrane receptor protein